MTVFSYERGKFFSLPTTACFVCAKNIEVSGDNSVGAIGPIVDPSAQVG